MSGSSGDYSGLAIGGVAWSNIDGIQYVSAADYKHYYTFPKGTYLVNINLFANLEASTSNVLGVALNIEVDGKQLVSLYVQGIVQDSMPQFEDILMNNLTSEMSKDQVYVKMLLNAVTLSTDLATQIILDLLDSTDVLPITSDEKVLQKLALRLHTDNLKK